MCITIWNLEAVAMWWRLAAVVVLCLISMWFFEFDWMNSNDNNKFMLVLDIFWYKIAVTSACALAQVVAVISHKLSAKIPKRFDLAHWA